MKFATTVLGVLAIASGINALPANDLATVEGRNAVAIEAREAINVASFEVSEELFKRKGGGGGGGRGGGSSGGSSGGTSGSPGSTSGGSGGARPGGTSGGTTGGTTGSTRGGSSVSPGYGGGRFYGGGSRSPVLSGTRSRGGISPLALGAGLAVGFGLYGLWAYTVYSYPYSQPWRFHNSTTDKEEEKPVICLCEEYSDCGCDDNTDPDYQRELLQDGSYDNLNKSLITVSDINGTSTIVLNGTIPNVTEEAGQSPTSDARSGAMHIVMQCTGYWALIALVGSAVFLV